MFTETHIVLCVLTSLLAPSKQQGKLRSQSIYLNNSNNQNKGLPSLHGHLINSELGCVINTLI